MHRNNIAKAVLLTAIMVPGCMKLHHSTTQPDVAPAPATAPSVMPMAPQRPNTTPVATSDLGTVEKVPGLAPKPKPFIALPKTIRVTAARPSTLLLQHASPDSPVPLSEYGNQPVHHISDFNLQSELSAHAIESMVGPPAQLADAEDPWLVYRLNNNREIWLHFTGPLHNQLDAADVIRGAEDGYVRDRVFPASVMR